MAHKQEYPPLLQQGFYVMSVKELHALCVDPFPRSTVRADIMAGFLTIYERYVELQITGELWMDGSFLTHKIDPGDIDFMGFIPPHFRRSGTPEQREFIEWLIAKEDEPRALFKSHTDVIEVVEKEHADYPLLLSLKNHWEKEVYGFSVTAREPKGIVVIHLPAPLEPKKQKDAKIKTAEVAR